MPIKHRLPLSEDYGHVGLENLLHPEEELARIPATMTEKY